MITLMVLCFIGLNALLLWTFHNKGDTFRHALIELAKGYAAFLCFVAAFALAALCVRYLP